MPLLATPLLAIPLLAYRSYSSGTVEVATKAVTSWSNVLDAPNEDQCGLFDVGAPTNDQRGPLDAPNDNQCAPNEPVVVSPEAFELTDPAVGAPADAAKRSGRSALLDAAAAERAGLRVEKNKGVACPPWWLPPFMANHNQAHSGNQVAHVDADDGKPHCDLMSNQSAGQPKPADSPSHAPPSSSIAKDRETTDWWTSSTLLCALIFVLSVYAFNGKGRARKKGAKKLNRTARSPKVLQLQVTGTGRTIMVDASPTTSAARLSRVIEKQTGVPQGSFSLYYGSRPMYGTLAESGVASGSTIELKSRGRGGGAEPPATSSSEVEIETRPASTDKPPAGLARGATAMMRGGGGPEPRATNSLEVGIEARPTSMDEPPAVMARGLTAMMHGYDRDGDGKFSREEVRAMAADFIKEKKTRRLATKAVIAMGAIILLVVGLNAGLTAALVFLSRDTEVDGSGRIVVKGTDTPASIENPHITTRTLTSLNQSLTVAGEEARFLSEASTAEVLVDAYGGAIAVAPLTNEADMLLSTMGQPVKTAPLTNEANTMLSASGEPVQVDAARYITYHDAEGIGAFLDSDFDELSSIVSFTVDYLAGSLLHVDSQLTLYM